MKVEKIDRFERGAKRRVEFFPHTRAIARSMPGLKSQGLKTKKRSTSQFREKPGRTPKF
jgi:hypothetical protein